MKRIISILPVLFCLLFSSDSFGLGIIGPPVICKGETTSYVSSDTLGGVWSSSNTSIATINLATGVATGISGGIVDISYTLGSSYAVKSVTVSQVNIVITGRDTICIGEKDTLYVNPTDSATGLSYAWTGNGISGPTGSSVTVLTIYSGVYWVHATNSSGCQDSVSFQLTVITCMGAGVNTISAQTDIEMYPNPVNSTLYVHSVEKLKDIRISNILGTEVLISRSEDENAAIDISFLPPGMYFVTVNNSERRKIVISRE